MEPGDTLVVTKFDRLGRNAMDVEATIKMLTDIPVKVHCLAIQGVDLASSGGALMQPMVASDFPALGNDAGSGAAPP